MVDQRPVKSLSMISSVVITIGVVNFLSSFIAIPIVKKMYPMLHGRPWLKGPKIFHNWDIQEMVIIVANKQIKILASLVEIPCRCRPKALEAWDEFPKYVKSTLMELKVLAVGEIDLFEVVGEEIGRAHV